DHAGPSGKSLQPHWPPEGFQSPNSAKAPPTRLESRRRRLQPKFYVFAQSRHKYTRIQKPRSQKPEAKRRIPFWLLAPGFWLSSLPQLQPLGGRHDSSRKPEEEVR